MPRLVTTIAEVQEYIRVGNGLDIKTITPSLNEVELQELTFYLGTDLLNEIITQKDAASYTSRIEKIAPYVISAHACLAVWKGGPEIEVQVSDNGINRIESDTEKAAYGGQVKRFRDVAADRGFSSIDSFLAILEKYEQDYPEWLESDYYAQKKGLFIRSAVEFESAGESIQGSALTYQALRPTIKDIQEITIKSALPETYFNELLTQLDEDSLTADNALILDQYIRPAVAKLTLLDGLSTLPVEISSHGVRVNQLELAGDSRTSKMADLASIEKKAYSLRGRGEYYLNQMKEYLNENASATKYSIWFNSDHYSKTLKAQIEEESIEPSERRIFRA